MASTFLLQVASFELPAGITPTVAGLGVGIITATIGFMIVMIATKPRVKRDDVMIVPPYDTGLERHTPMPKLPPVGKPIVLPFTPSNGLSARAFAKMGMTVDAVTEDPPSLANVVEVPFCEEEVDVDVDAGPDSKGHTLRMSWGAVAASQMLPPPPIQPQTIIDLGSAAMRAAAVASPEAPVAAHEASSFPPPVGSAMRPLAPSSSGVVSASDGASIEELDFDDALTHAMDPRPQASERRTSSSMPAAPRPKIRRATPVPERFPRRTG